MPAATQGPAEAIGVLSDASGPGVASEFGAVLAPCFGDGAGDGVMGATESAGVPERPGPEPSDAASGAVASDAAASPGAESAGAAGAGAAGAGAGAAG
ncbi:hypothetical protein, partial [Microbacterium sp.]|uniref:hypothetical protein n=1 Tax=Microbacterium sp. TaxID=51671 RepID=UPI002729AFA6